MHKEMQTTMTSINPEYVLQIIPPASLRALCAAVLDAAEQFYETKENNENKEEM